MRAFRPFLRLLCGFAVALFAGAQASASTTPLRPSWWRDAPTAARAGIYVTETNGAGTTEFYGFTAQNRKNDPPLCTIDGLTNVVDIASDAAGNVYVPSFTGDLVTVFAPGCGKVLASIYDPFGAPEGVSFFGSTTYITGSKNVAVCTNGACHNALVDASILEITGSAVDSKGNVWAAYYNTKGAVSLLVWPAGSTVASIISGYQDEPVPGGILFDAHDSLISIFSGFGQINTYRCDVQSRACKMARSLPTHGRSNFAALNRSNTNLAISDFGNASVDIYAYPSLRYEYSFNNGFSTDSSVKGITQTK